MEPIVNDPVHRQAWDSIPWFVAGSASDDECTRLQDHLPHCADCREELAFQQQVQRGLQAGPEARDAEAGLQRLLARREVEQGEGPPAALPARAGVSNATRWLVAAVLVQALALGAITLVLFDHRRDGAEYRTLSNPAAPAAATVRLVPGPGLDFAALRRVLQQTRMGIVEAAADGSSLGLTPLDGDPATTAAALPQLRALREVRMAEPTGAGR